MTPDFCKFHAGTVPWPGMINVNNFADMTGTGGENHNPVRKEYRFIDTVRHEQDRLFRLVPDLQQVVLEPVPGLGIQCTERFVHEQY